jgi:hypothetical protein
MIALLIYIGLFEKGIYVFDLIDSAIRSKRDFGNPLKAFSSSPAVNRSLNSVRTSNLL